MRTSAISAALALALAIGNTALAAPFYVDGVTSIVLNHVNEITGVKLGQALFPTKVQLTVDDGLLDVQKIDIYNQTQTAIGYSFPPQQIALEPFFDGQLGFDPTGVFRFLVDAQPDSPTNWSPLVMTTTEPFRFQAALGSGSGVSTWQWDFLAVSIPEPSTWLIAAVCVMLLLASNQLAANRRNRREQRRPQHPQGGQHG